MKLIKLLLVILILSFQSVSGWELRFFFDEEITTDYKILAYRYDLTDPLFGIDGMLIEGTEYDAVWSDGKHGSQHADFEFWIGFDLLRDIGNFTEPRIGDGKYEFQIYRDNVLVFKFKLDLLHYITLWDIDFYYTHSTGLFQAKANDDVGYVDISFDQFIGCWTIHGEPQDISYWTNSVVLTNAGNNQTNDEIATELTNDIWGFPYDEYSIGDEFSVYDEIDFWKGATYGLTATAEQYSRNDSLFKFRHWANYNKYEINSNFKILVNTDEIKSLYFPTHPLTVNNYLEGGSGDEINVAWLPEGEIISDENIPSGQSYDAFDATNLPDRYNLTANADITNQYGTDWTFLNWDDGTTSTTLSNVAVSAPTTKTAYYKGLMRSDAAGAYANSGQRKVLRTSDGNLYHVYESMGKVWLEKSTNDGSSWTIMNSGGPWLFRNYR